MGNALAFVSRGLSMNRTPSPHPSPPLYVFSVLPASRWQGMVVRQIGEQ